MRVCVTSFSWTKHEEPPRLTAWFPGRGYIRHSLNHHSLPAPALPLRRTALHRPLGPTRFDAAAPGSRDQPHPQPERRRPGPHRAAAAATPPRRRHFSRRLRGGTACRIASPLVTGARKASGRSPEGRLYLYRRAGGGPPALPQAPAHSLPPQGPWRPGAARSPPRWGWRGTSCGRSPSSAGCRSAGWGYPLAPAERERLPSPWRSLALQRHRVAPWLSRRRGGRPALCNRPRSHGARTMGGGAERGGPGLGGSAHRAPLAPPSQPHARRRGGARGRGGRPLRSVRTVAGCGRWTNGARLARGNRRSHARFGRGAVSNAWGSREDEQGALRGTGCPFGSVVLSFGWNLKRSAATSRRFRSSRDSERAADLRKHGFYFINHKNLERCATRRCVPHSRLPRRGAHPAAPPPSGTERRDIRTAERRKPHAPGPAAKLLPRASRGGAGRGQKGRSPTGRGRALPLAAGPLRGAGAARSVAARGRGRRRGGAQDGRQGRLLRGGCGRRPCRGVSPQRRPPAKGRPGTRRAGSRLIRSEAPGAGAAA